MFDIRGQLGSRVGTQVPLAFGLSVVFAATEAFGYIGPGAGFAFLSSFFALFLSFLLALFFLLTWPLRWLVQRLRRRHMNGPGSADRVVIVGLDGFDPELAERFIAEGELPHLARLHAEGSFNRLQTTCPSISPVAWSTFSTGVNPGRHNIYDFLTRDPRTYQPKLSSAEVSQTLKRITIGKFALPLERPKCEILRKSKPFWRVLGEQGIFSTVLRVPITFPPEKFRGVLLSGMCVPDLRGTQGSFTLYTSAPAQAGGQSHDSRIEVALQGSRARSFIRGPVSPFSARGEELRVPFSIEVDPQSNAADLEISGRRIRLEQGRYSQWVVLRFKAGFGVKIQGIARFYLRQVSPHVEIYLSPVHIDPEKPALPVSHPRVYSIYLSKLLGKYATLGLAEDTSALNEQALDEEAFLAQCELIHAERERMFFDALAKTRKGLCVCVFDMPDRVQHMFFRFLDNGLGTGKYGHVIRDTYKRMDDLVGRVIAETRGRTVLMVLSDHGFKAFRKGVNLNAWLRHNGYLFVKDRAGSREWLEEVDWDRTRAYAVGLNGLYINLRGREARGIVDSGLEYEGLKRELIDRLGGLKDGDGVAVNKVFDAAEVYNGPYREAAPDLIIGYNEGYRASWECVVGKVTEQVFEENRKSWSGDHCIDPRLVPGVLFCNRSIDGRDPAIVDIAPTVLKIFGVEIPAYMEGKPLLP